MSQIRKNILRLLMSAGLVAPVYGTCVLAAPSEKEKKILVLASSLKCVVENGDKYLALDKDPIIIFFDLCPTTEPTSLDLLAFATNSLPRVRTDKKTDPSAPLSITALRKKEIVCLLQMWSDGLVSVQSDDVQEDDVVEISFENCPP